MKARNRNTWLLVLALVGAGFACSDDSEDEAPPDSGSFTRRDAGNDEGEDDAATDKDDAGVADAGEEDTATASEKEAKAKGWVVGCYKKPKSSEELLNSCASGWREFDKTWYPASWQEGKPLPTLP